MASDNLLDFWNNSSNTNAPSSSSSSSTNKSAGAGSVSKEEIIKALKEYDGSDLGLLTSKQCLAAMREIKNLGMTEEESKEYVELASEICGDGVGKIKLEEFASNLMFEVRKREKKNEPHTASKANDNPFVDDTSGKLATQSSTHGGDMDSFFTSDSNEAVTIPDWYGGSVYSTNAKSTHSEDGWVFDDDKQGGGEEDNQETGLIAPPRSKEKHKERTPPPGATRSGEQTRQDTTEDTMDVFGMSNDAPKVAKTKSTSSTNVKKTEGHEPEPESEPAQKVAPAKKRTDAILEMKRGTAMLKYGRRGFPHFHRFQISDDLTRLIWFSRKKNIDETCVGIAEMKEILEGHQTSVFKQCTQKALEKASFSIVYSEKLKTLDLVAKSFEEAKLWVKGLRGLIKAQKQGRLNKVAQILVNVDYTDLDKPNYRNSKEDKYTILRGYENKELVHAMNLTLVQTRKSYKAVQELMRNPDIQKLREYPTTQEFVSQLEQRIEELELAFANKTADLQELKKDVWVLKVDVTVLHEKLDVMAKSKFFLL